MRLGPSWFGSDKHPCTHTHTHPSCCKHSAEVWSLFLWLALFAYQLPLSFKELLFPPPNLNMLIWASIVIPSHPVFAVLLPELLFTLQSRSASSCPSALQNRNETIVSNSPTRFSVWAIKAGCNICSSWGLYVFTRISQTPREREGNLSLNSAGSLVRLPSFLQRNLKSLGCSCWVPIF